MINSSELAELSRLFAPGPTKARSRVASDAGSLDRAQKAAPAPEKDVLEAAQASGAKSQKGASQVGAASEAGASRTLGLDRQTLEANREDSRRKLGQARLKLVSQVLGAGFLLATLVTSAVLCPPALVLVAPVCVFAGHILLGAFNKTLAEKEAARGALASATHHLRPFEEGDDALSHAAPAASRLTRGDSAVSQSLSGFDGDEGGHKAPVTPRAPRAKDALATPTAAGAVGTSPTSPTPYEQIDQSCRTWLEAREVQQQSQKTLEASTLRLKAAGSDLRTHLAGLDAA